MRSRRSHPAASPCGIWFLLLGIIFGRNLPVHAGQTLTDWQARISNHVASARLAHASWGIQVVSLDSGRSLFEHNPGKLLKPASNAKLYTAAMALDRLGPEHRIRTSLLGTARPDGTGTLQGDLVVYGRGDPSLSVRFGRLTYATLLEPVVSAMTNAGIRRIEGDLVGDESFFHGSPFGSGWMWDDSQSHHGPEVSALSVQDNVVDLVFRPGSALNAACRIETLPASTPLRFDNHSRTVHPGTRTGIRLYRPPGGNDVDVSGSVALGEHQTTAAMAVHDPALWYVTLLREALGRHGIQVRGRTRTLDWRARRQAPLETARLIELGAVTSPPMRELVRQMMKPSQNLYAQLLLLQAGRNSPRRDDEATSEEAGLAELRAFLKEAGVPPGEVYLDEGAGLSHAALATPQATVRLLRHMATHRHAEAFRESLPIAGVDGTLRHRLTEEGVAGNIRAKTGTLRFVNCLSGYAKTAAGERVAFSIMLNHYPPSDGQSSGRNEVDAVAAMIARLDVR